MLCKFSGIAIGMCAASVGIYLAEISITSWKTVITVTPNIALTTGILIVYLLGFVLQVRALNFLLIRE